MKLSCSISNLPSISIYIYIYIYMQISQLVWLQDITAQEELEATEDKGPAISHCLYVPVTDVPMAATV